MGIVAMATADLQEVIILLQVGRGHNQILII